MKNNDNTEVKKKRAAKEGAKTAKAGDVVAKEGAKTAKAGDVAMISPAPRPDGSNERADVARRILELSGTISEAIEYMLGNIESLQGDINNFAGILKDVGDGLISLESAAGAISEPSGADPDDVRRLETGYDELSDRVGAMVEAYLENRSGDFSKLVAMFRDSYIAYDGHLTHCFRKMSII